MESNYFGSMTQCSTVKIGVEENGKDVNIPFCELLPMISPNELVISGWDLNKRDLATAMKVAKVFEYDLQTKLEPFLKEIVPLPAIYFPDFIASNQKDRADNILQGSIQEQMDQIRKDISTFKSKNKLDKVIILWSATTERFVDVEKGVNDTAETLLDSIKKGSETISPSTLYAVASILEGCSYINGSPQNSLVPGVIDLAQKKKVYISGDDFKTGQTKIKSVLVDFLVGAGIKPRAIVSYNHLG